MRCEDFTQWLQQRLDERGDLEMPSEIDAHVVRCESCRGQLTAWNQISTILPVERPAIIASDEGRSRRPQIAATIATIAAIVLLSFVAGRSDGRQDPLIASATPDSQPASSQPASSQPASSTHDSHHLAAVDLAAVDLDVDPAILWQQIQSSDWVAQSMPTVQSVRDSIAPMGRSLVQAMTILATGGRDQHS